MAGLKAATAAPTWPSINGSWGPGSVGFFGTKEFSGISYLFDNPLVVHFIHRNLAYIITILVVAWSWKAFKLKGPFIFQKTKGWPLLLVLFQVILGIATVLNAANQDNFLWLGVTHQFIAMLLLLSLVWMLFIIRGKQNVNQ
jgi:cytochrome c oxidase assembly protein subunit 15